MKLVEKEVVLMQIGNTIKHIREEKNVSQAQLAADCNFEKSNMNRIEKGKTNITVGTLVKIANALNVPLSKLIEE